jgi:hypothetical protein
MAKWGQQMSAEEILGMKPEDLRSKLDSSATKDDLTGVNTKLGEFETSLSSIQTMLSKLTSKPETPDPTLEADLNDPTTQMLTDPSGYVSRQTQGIANTAAAARADINEMRARNKYPGAFAKYGDELVTTAKNFSLAQRAGENFWDFHIETITGRKVLKGEIESGSYPSLMGSSSFAPNSSGNENDPNKGLDPQIAAFLKDRGVPLDKAAMVKQAQDNGEPVDINTYRKAG